MIELYGKSEARLAMPDGSEALAPLKARADTQDAESAFRIKPPGHGWRILRYPTLSERIAGQRAPYVTLSGSERATVIG